jgi:hypothetical protein
MANYLIFIAAGVFVVPLALLGFWALRVEKREYRRLVKNGRI